MNKTASINLHLLLLGKTGNGKSATGNTILQSKVFESLPSMDSITKEIQFGVCQIEGRTVKVVDGPGLADTMLDTEKAVDLVKSNLEQAIALNPFGYNALIIVIKYGNRFTKEEQETIKFLKGLFSNNFIEDYGILVMTYGDNFVKDHEITDRTFKGWCMEQTRDFAEILKDCKGRIVLFDNKTKDKDKQNSQLRTLMHLVDDIQTQRGPYTDENFELAKKARENILRQSKRPLITDSMLIESNLIAQRLSEMQSNRLEGDWLQNLKYLLVRAEILHAKAVSEDGSTGYLKCMIKHTDNLKKNISRELEKEHMTENIEFEDLVGSYKQVNTEYNDDFVRGMIKNVQFPLRYFSWL